MKKKFFSLLLAVIVSIGTMFASDTQVDGIWYDFNTNAKTASVTYRGSACNSYSNEYTGSVVIPTTVTYNAVTYSVTSIFSTAFYYCSGLTSVTIPNSVTSIGSRAFEGCTNLTSVTINSNSIVSKTYTSDSNLKTIFGGRVTKYIIGEDVTGIGDYAFCGSSLTGELVIPNSVTSIGQSAFYYCSGLTGELVIPNSVNSIGSYAFSRCNGLTSVTIPNSVTSMGRRAFYECSSLISVAIGNSVTSIGDSAFYNCSGLTGELIIPNSVTSIGDGAFRYCSGLTSVTIGNSVTSIGDGAFRYCSGLTSVTIGNSVTSIGDYAFCGSGLTGELIIPNSVTSIGDYAFSSCSGLTSVTIPNSVTSIGSYAFSSCTYLENISIGSGIGINGISQNAFKNCTYLLVVACKAEYPPVINANVFEGCGVLSQIDLYVPEESVKRYQKADVWSEFNIIGANFDESSTPEKYEITWLNYDGSELYVDSLEYGVIPEYKGETPQKESTAAYTYTFKGWKPNIVAVTSDAIYIAQFDSHKIEYNVDVTIPDSIESHGSVVIDGTPTYGETIILTPQPEDGYVFEGWSDGNTDNPREVVVDGDVNIYPIFHKCEEIITLTEVVIGKGESYEFGGKLYSTRGVYYDTITLANGCDSISTLKLSVMKKKTFNLRVVVDSTQLAWGTATGSGIYNDGQTVTIEAIPASSKYVFARWWNPDEGIEIFENPYTFTLTRNLTVKAVFKRAPKRIVVKQQGASHAMSHVETDIVAVIEVGEKTATVNNTSESAYRIYDSAGHLVITSAEDNTYVLPSGLYFIQIDEHSEKFIVQ